MKMFDRAVLGAVGLLSFSIIAVAPACSSSSDSGGSAGKGGGGGSGGGSALSCDAYCTAIMANCTANNQQYGTKENCVASCASFPTGAASDTSGNTLGCRTYHAGAAKTDPTTHCPHAGPGGAGVCGANCDGYCQIAMKYCVGPNQVYTSDTDCQTTCKSAKTDERLGVSPEPTGNQVACLLYHAQEGSTVAPDHCLGDLKKDPGGASITCQDGTAGAGGGTGDGG